MLKKISLIQRIIIGLIAGILLGVLVPNMSFVSLLGNLFVSSLRSIAPLLVFFIVMSALANHQQGKKTNIKQIVALYLIGTFGAALVAVVVSFLFNVSLSLNNTTIDAASAPQGVSEIFQSLLLNSVDNPVSALSSANYIGILFWAVVFGLALQLVKESITKKVLHEVSHATSKVVEWIIGFAPIGIFGLVYDMLSSQGVQSLVNYAQLLVVLVGAMIFTALVVNPLIVFLVMRQNPYPLVWRCLKDSGVTAFFTRSSAANIPVNMQLCHDLGLDEDTYSVSIPLGATINMQGAAITITVLTLACVHTLGISVGFFEAFILSIVAAISACGASGVAGGSLLLIPVACSLFGIPSDIAMQVVGVGFVIGVVQDSFETALNSSTDVLFTAAAEFAKKRK